MNIEAKREKKMAKIDFLVARQVRSKNTTLQQSAKCQTARTTLGHERVDDWAYFKVFEVQVC